jgi:branched-chain amino acid transport system permease protein
MSVDPRTLGIACLFFVLLALPFALGNYGHYILATVMIYGMVALSLNILIGMGGQISIGHAGFWALGAYGSALAVTKFGAPFLLGVATGGIVAALSGALVALPALGCRATTWPSPRLASRCSFSKCCSNGRH